MNHLDDLPVSVLLNLLSFLHDDLAVKLLSRKNTANFLRHGATIRDLAAVSKSWASVIAAVEGHFRDTVLAFAFQQVPVPDNETHLTISTADKSDEDPVNEARSGGIFQLLARRGRTKRIGPLKEEGVADAVKLQHVENELKRLLEAVTTGKQSRLRVELWLNDPLDVTIHDYDDKSSKVSGVVLQRWGHIFSNRRHLVCLDLSGVPMESDHTPAILNAGGENCVNLEELAMPQQTHLMQRRRSVHNVLEAFHAALASFDALSRSRPGKRGGLKKLALPRLFPNENVVATAAVIGQHCPNLEHIEGLRLAAFFRRRRLTSVEMRQSSLQSWEAFCKGCSHLAALNWCSIPCSEEVFDIFALYPKLELKSLVLPGNTALWRRDYVLQERHHVEPLSPSNRFGPVLRACPNLTSLEVLLSDMQGDSEFLGDQFLRHVVDACQLLEKLALVEASVHHGFGISNVFTSEGLEALTSLCHLEMIEINGVNFSGSTLVSLATRPCPPYRPRTRVDVTVGVRGCNVVDVATCFDKTILELLNLLLSPAASEYPAFIIRVRPDTHNYSPPVMWEAPSHGGDN